MFGVLLGIQFRELALLTLCVAGVPNSPGGGGAIVWSTMTMSLWPCIRRTLQFASGMVHTVLSACKRPKHGGAHS